MATATQVLVTAAREIGYVERPVNITKYWAELYPAYQGGQWCAAFIQWCLRKHGMWAGAPAPYYCPSLESWAKKKGYWVTKSQGGRPGDLVLFDWQLDGISDHIGFYEKTVTGGVQTIEGNTSPGNKGSQSNGGGVYRRFRTLRTIRGYIRLPYSGVPSSGSTSSTPTLRRGDRGDAVKDLQRRLGGLTVDGSFGPATETKVKAFQKSKGLVVDGVVGAKTWAALKAPSGGTATGGSTTTPTLRRGSRGDAVKELQRLLGGLTVDGSFGPATETKVKAFQKSKGLVVDGVVGAKTWAALRAKPATTTVSNPVNTAFPLPAGHWYGQNDKTQYSHSGVKTADQPNIKKIQKKVGVSADGKFGPRTAEAVKSYQRKHNLRVDAKVGPSTWGKMRSTAGLG